VKPAGTGYLQEEKRGVGARPRLQVEIGPFAVDTGLQPGQGSFVNCHCPRLGELRLADGYVTQGSWTSPILQPYLGQLSTVIPSCVSLLAYATAYLFRRAAEDPATLSEAPWLPVAWGGRAELGPYCQLRIEFRDFTRSWAVNTPGEADAYTAYGLDGAGEMDPAYAVDGVFPGELRELALAGWVVLDEAMITACQPVVARRPVSVHDFPKVTHTLTLDNRRRQWIPGHQNFLMADGLWHGKELRLYTGFDLPAGEVAWVLQYVGRIKDIREITAASTGKHQAKIFSVQAHYDALQQLIGAPGPDGRRRPYLAGPYKTRAELVASEKPHLGSVTKVGQGSAQLVAMGEPTNSEDREFLIEAETTGEITAATWRWSIDGGASWEKTGLLSTTSTTPSRLQEGVMVYFVPGGGTDLVAGDRFTFTAYTRASRYTVPGAPFAAFTNLFFNGAELSAYEANPETGDIFLKGPTGVVEVRLVKGAISNPVDIIQDILESLGLRDALDPVSFAAARQALADYQIGVRFEGIPAWKALQAICEACLLFCWSEADKIYVAAYEP
jgi:hypothetical protein